MIKMQYGAAVEAGGTGLWYGRIIEYIGTHARGNSYDELLSRLHDELEFHMRWLQKYGMNNKVGKIGSIEVLETKSGIPELGESGGQVALFEFDKQPVSHSELEMIVDLMTHNREDLVMLTGGLPNSALQEVPMNKHRNIIDIMHHICNAEEWYISRFGEQADRMYEIHLGAPHSNVDKLPIFERLHMVRGACIATLRELATKMGARKFSRSDYTKYPEENWTARKVLRRFLEHEREHIYNIRMYLGLPVREVL